jgi:isoquinoline 1-oxidoreductase subunit beta
MQIENVSRRRFLKSTAVVGGGVVIGFSMVGCSSPGPLPIELAEGGFVPNAFLQLLPDNTLRFYTPRDEMGQGVTTGLSTLIGEEFDFDPLDMEIRFAGVHEDYNNPGMGVQATGGSNATHAHYEQLRQVGANARALILAAAEQDLAIAQDQMSTDNGEIRVGSERYPYGQFVRTAATLNPPSEAPLKHQSAFRYIGRESTRVDALAKSNGTAVYGIDIDVPGMHHAVVKRSPVAGAELQSFDAEPIKAMAGVTDVIEIGSGVAVVAERYWQAKMAADALDVNWTSVPLSKVNSETIRLDYEVALTSDEALVPTDEGDVDAQWDSAEHVLEADYWTPFLSHAPMEPMNAVVRIQGDEAEVWSGTQGPVAAQGLVARFSGIDPERVKVHQTYLGGAFGRRGTLTHIIEATQVAVATGKPIHLLWSREDDLKHGLYRPASLVRLKAGVSAAGKIVAWDAARAGGNISEDTIKNMMPALFPGLGDGLIDWTVGLAQGALKGWVTDPSSIEGLFEDYDQAHTRVKHATINHGIPLTFWRSVGHSYTAFAKESMIDELALALNQDPVAFRLDNTKNNPRLQNVIRVAGDALQGLQPKEGRYLGFAAHHSFLTDVAQIAEVSVQGGQIQVHKVLCVVDCGIAVNPDIVRAQMEGAIMFGLTAALHGEHRIQDGEVMESNFDNYPILRMKEAPSVDVVIIPSTDKPTGVGEPGLPPIAPAVANAVYRATGQRLRSLPLRLT